ncbi:MAG: translocation/assembly module TamB domain-containing protein [Paracoccus sp. (in: a-proteobacteria)]|nr:translocation/assembly module TamB domain-containing protein [Paracoccus sp. (in: a-proteobacteria)]
MRQVMRKLATVLSVVLCLALILPGVATAQNRDSAADISQQESDDVGFLTRFLQTRLSAAGREVRITGFEGALSSRATFQTITIADDNGIWMTLHDGAIQWNRARLFTGNVDIGELSARLIEIPRPPQPEQDADRPTPEARPFALPELPVGINIGQINAERVSLGPDFVGEPVDLAVTGQMSLSGGEGNADLTIERLDGKRGSFVFDGAFSNTTRVLSLDLTLDEEADGLFANIIGLHGRPAVSAHIQGEGPLSDFTTDIQLATDGQPRITGAVSLATAEAPDAQGGTGSLFTIQIGGDVGSLLPEDGAEFFGNNALLAAEGWLGEDGRLLVPSLTLDTNALKIDGNLATNDDTAPIRAALTILFGAEAGVAEASLPVRIPGIETDTTVRSGRLVLDYDAAKSSGWSLDGWLADIVRPEMTLAALDLNGQGQVQLDDEMSLTAIDGAIRFAANMLSFTDDNLRQAVGDNLGGSTNFEFVPGQVVHLTGLNIGTDTVSLGGEATIDGLSSGIVLSGEVTAAHRDLSTLSGFAGRDLTGRADARINGYYQLLSDIFDVDIEATGTDITVDQDQADRLLAGESTIIASVRRDEDGIELREVSINAQRIRFDAEGLIASDSSSVIAVFDVPGLDDLDENFSGSMRAQAILSGPAGARRLNLEGMARDLQTGIKEIDGGFAGQTQLAAVVAETGDGFQVEQLRLTNPQINVQGNGRFVADDLNATIVVEVPELAAFDRGLSGGLRADGSVVTEDGARVIRATGTGTDLRLGQQEVDGALTGETRFALHADERDGDITIHRLDLTNDQMSATAHGQIGETTDATATVSIADLAAFGRGWGGSLDANARLIDEDAGRRLTVTGTGRDLSLGQVQADGMLSGDTNIDISAFEQNRNFRIDRAEITNEQARISAQGMIGPDGTDATADLEISDLAALGLGWRGRLAGEASLRDDGAGARAFTLDGTGQDIALGQAQADAALAGETRIIARGKEQGGTITIDTARIENARLSAEAQGTIGDGVTDLNARLAAADLGFLGRGFGGGINAQGHVVDQGGLRRFDVTGTGNDLTIGQGQLDAALAGQTQFAATGTEQGGVITLDDATLRNARLNAQASGTVGAGVTDVTARLASGDLSFIGGGLRGGIDAVARVQDQTGGARLIEASGTATNLGTGNAQADRLLAGQTRFDAQIVQDGQRIEIQRLDARNPQAQIIASGDPQQALNLDARLANLDLLVPGLTGPAQATGTIRQGADAYEIDIAATGPGGTRAQIAGTAASDFSTANIAMSGISNAAVANPFIRTRSIEGPISFDLRLDGPPDLDSLTGTIRLSNASVADPRLGMRLEGLNITANLDRGLINLDGAGQMSAGGGLTLSGPINLRGSPSVDVTIRLNDMVLRDPALYEARLNGVVTASGVLADGALISGTVLVSEAEIRIPSTGLGGAREIPEMIHRGDSWAVRTTRARAGLEPFGSLAAQQANLGGPAATPPATPLRLDLNIEAPNQIFVRGRGVDAELGGSIRITGTARNVVPIGFFELIRGRVDLLGKRFDLTEGLIELQGDLRPILRLVATNVQSDLTTRIIIDGEIMEPEIRFESTPELPQEEVLSQLLFGRGLENITALQAAQLANAIAVLAGQGGAGVIGNLRDSMGLDDLDFTSDDEGNVSVRAGRYLSRNVYTDVEVGGDGDTRVNLNLDLTPSLTARGSVGTDGNSTLGLYYERDY